MTQRVSVSIRRVDCVEAEAVLSNGVYLTFRQDIRKSLKIRHCIETKRTRMGAKHGDSIPLDARIWEEVRREVHRAIMAHRAKMQLPPAPIELRYTRPRQLDFVF